MECCQTVCQHWPCFCRRGLVEVVARAIVDFVVAVVAAVVAVVVVVVKIVRTENSNNRN